MGLQTDRQRDFSAEYGCISSKFTSENGQVKNMDDRKNIKLIIDDYFKKLIQPVSVKEYI